LALHYSPEEKIKFVPILESAKSSGTLSENKETALTINKNHNPCARAKLSYVIWYHPSSRSLQKAHIFLAISPINGLPNRDQTEHQKVVTIPAQQIINRMKEHFATHQLS
jgi:hypothetical protein